MQYVLSVITLIVSGTPIINARQPMVVDGSIAERLTGVVDRRDFSAVIVDDERSQYLAKRGAKWTVHAGDTGNKIAAQLGIKFFQLAFMNPTVRWKFLQIGQTLNIPSRGDDDHTYVVVAGDTGNAIAAANGITFAQLEAYNRNVDWYNLQIGQTLVIPYPRRDAALISQLPNIEQAEQEADTPATGSRIPIVPPVSDGETATTSTKNVSPFLIPGETPSPSNDSSSQLLEVRQIAKPAAPSGSMATSAGTTYTVKAGDTGYGIAAQFGITFEALSRVNPGVNWNSLQIGQTLIIPPGARTPSSTVIPPIGPSSCTQSSSTPTLGTYITYSGAVNATQPPYPPMSSWMPFTQLWGRNLPNIGTWCSFASGSVTPNSLSETASLKSAILDISAETNVQPSFILAMIMQESNGCVRAPTTTSWEDIQNPGLMQSFNGRASCNKQGRVQSPCQDFLIKAMVLEGVKGNQNVGVVPALRMAARQSSLQWPLATNAGASVNVDDNARFQGARTNGQIPRTGVTNSGSGSLGARGMDEAMLYYQAARIYNSGSLPPDGDLSAPTGSTRCYVSDVVNRLMGWTGVERGCSLN